MSIDPANPNLSQGTASPPALGGPLPSLRLLPANGNGRGWRTGLGFLLHTAAVTVLFLLPLLMTEQITGSPAGRSPIIISALKGSPMGSAASVGEKTPGSKSPVANQREAPKLVLPNSPIRPTPGSGEIRTAGPDSGSIPFGVPEGIEGGTPMTSFSPAFIGNAVPLPTEPVPVVPGGKVRFPKLLQRVEPSYPDLAKQAGIQGTVLLEATLGADGRVKQIAVINGHPLLVEAAKQAVSQWVYEPTYLNGRPVPVLLRVTVEFVLRR